MKLVIISHTEHYLNPQGTIVGWGPTVNEINHLAPHFESVTHVAMLHKSNAPKSSIKYDKDNIHFVPLPPLGGTSFLSKLKLLFAILKVLKIVEKALKNADAFQLRTPTGIGVFLIPYLWLCTNKKGWFKYAGNWSQQNPPIGYGLQRWMLKKQNRIVTINGTWPKQSKHCLTFENPCLTTKDLEKGAEVFATKTLPNKIHFCYVGRLESPKGVGRIIDAFLNLSNAVRDRVGMVHFVGDGNEASNFKSKVEESNIDFRFHGYLKRENVFDIYKKSHFFLMPTTASEGFPKVIAEALNFGCIPLVSNVSAIGQYIHHKKNGFVLKEASTEELKLQIEYLLQMKNSDYKSYLLSSRDMVKSFTFKHYNSRILNEILNEN